MSRVNKTNQSKTPYSHFLGESGIIKSIRRKTSVRLPTYSENELPNFCIVTSTCISGHASHQGNESTDELSDQTQPFHSDPKLFSDIATKNWPEKSKTWWQHTSVQKQTKEFLKESLPKFTDLLSIDRKLAKFIVDSYQL